MTTLIVRCAVIAALAIMAAPGCDTVEPGDSRGVTRADGDRDAVKPPKSKAEAEAATPNVTEPPPTPKQSAKTAAPPTAIPPRRPGPESKALVGKTEKELKELLGMPSEVRNEPPALVWNYRAKQCSLDVFMYFDVGQEGFRSLAYRFYPETRVAWAERKCLAGIRNARSKTGKSN